MKIWLQKFKNHSHAFLKQTYFRLGSTLLFGFVVALGALIFFAWFAGEMLEGDTKRFDDAVRGAVHQFAAPPLTIIMQTASFVGSTGFLVIAGTLFCFGLLFLKRRRAAILFAVTTLGSSLLLITLKMSFARARPEPFFNELLPASYSFPSGHSLGALCFYGAAAAIITARLKNRWLAIIIWVIAALLTILIGLSRIYLGVHYPSDVIAGYAAGLVWVVTIAVCDRLFLRPQQI